MLTLVSTAGRTAKLPQVLAQLLSRRMLLKMLD